MERSDTVRAAQKLIQQLGRKRRLEKRRREQMLTAHLELGFLECQLSELLASAKEEERLQIDECLNRIKKTFFLPQDKHIFKKFLSVRAQQP